MVKLKEILDTVFEDMNTATNKQFEAGRVYSNPHHTAFKLNESVEKVLYIMIGLPGSGKSTFIKTLPNPVVCSADHYFEQGGEYKFDVNKLGAAHQQCKNKVQDNMLMSKPLIVVDNTNLNDKERKPYEDLAEKHGYTIKYILFEPDKHNIEKLAKRNLHGVPAAKLSVMLDRYRPPSGHKGEIQYVKN